MNKVILIGRLCADPEIRYTQNQKPVATYRLAVDRQYKQDGQAATDFLNCVAWNRSAEFVSKNLVKGTKVAIEGRIQTRTYENQDGKTVYVTEIVVDHHEFCERRAAATDNADQGYSEMTDADPEGIPF